MLRSNNSVPAFIRAAWSAGRGDCARSGIAEKTLAARRIRVIGLLSSYHVAGSDLTVFRRIRRPAITPPG
jgi:hypothetical protein